MKFKAASCEKCGAPLYYDTEKQILFCQYCETSYVIENEDSDRKKQLLRNAKAWEDAGNFEKALGCYEKALDADPNEGRAWWGKLCLLTDDLECLVNSHAQLDTVEECWKNVLRLGAVGDSERKKMSKYAKDCSAKLGLASRLYGDYTTIGGAILRSDTACSLAERYLALMESSGQPAGDSTS